MDANELKGHLSDAAEALEMLAGGESGLMHNADNAKSVAAMLMEVLAIAQLVCDELGVASVDSVGDEAVEDLVDGWYETAAKVDARHGEEC